MLRTVQISSKSGINIRVWRLEVLLLQPLGSFHFIEPRWAVDLSYNKALVTILVFLLSRNSGRNRTAAAFDVVRGGYNGATLQTAVSHEPVIILVGIMVVVTQVRVTGSVTGVTARREHPGTTYSNRSDINQGSNSPNMCSNCLPQEALSSSNSQPLIKLKTFTTRNSGFLETL